MALVGATVLTPEEEVVGATVVIEGGQVRGVLPVGGVPVGATVVIEGGQVRGVLPVGGVPVGATVVSLHGLYLAPGLIDLHTHGGFGLSFASMGAEGLRAYARKVVSRGVTAFLASLAAPSQEEALAAVEELAQACGPVPGGAEALGLHLEGPFLSPARLGALPPSWPHPPSLPLLEAYVKAGRGRLRLLTLAPELPGAEEVARLARGEGVKVALGHTDATYEEARQALAWGLDHVTHLFNAMRPFHHREPGPVLAALEGDVTCQLIADGVHVHPRILALVLALKGPRQLALVSDSSPLAGLGQGEAELWGRRVFLRGARAHLADGTLAGSALTLEAMVANMVRWGLCTLREAVAMASLTPARALGLKDKGRIAPGADADLVALDGDLQVVMTWARGELVYVAPGVQGRLPPGYP